MRTLPALLVYLLFSFTIIGPCAIEARAESVAEVVVTGKRPGPPLWSVTSGDNVLWVFGTLTPLPRQMKWDDASVERILAEADELITPPAYSVSVTTANPFRVIGLLREFNKLKKLPDEKEVTEVMPDELLELYQGVLATYEIKPKGLSEYRPLFLAEEVSKRALKKVGLVSNQKIQKRIRKLAKKNDLTITVSVGNFSVEEGLQLIEEMTLEHELACLEVTLQSLDRDVEKAKRRALAWADGQSTRDPMAANVAQVCSNVLAATPSAALVFQQTRELWLTNSLSTLRRNRVSFAYLPMAEILTDDGLLSQLRSAVTSSEN